MSVGRLLSDTPSKDFLDRAGSGNKIILETGDEVRQNNRMEIRITFFPQEEIS